MNLNADHECSEKTMVHKVDKFMSILTFILKFLLSRHKVFVGCIIWNFVKFSTILKIYL
jgi:hypothetical protein